MAVFQPLICFLVIIDTIILNVEYLQGYMKEINLFNHKLTQKHFNLMSRCIFYHMKIQQLLINFLFIIIFDLNSTRTYFQMNIPNKILWLSRNKHDFLASKFLIGIII